MNPEYIYDAPMKIGRKLVGKNKVKGDCGYGIEDESFVKLSTVNTVIHLPIP